MESNIVHPIRESIMSPIIFISFFCSLLFAPELTIANDHGFGTTKTQTANHSVANDDRITIQLEPADETNVTMSNASRAEVIGRSTHHNVYQVPFSHANSEHRPTKRFPPTWFSLTDINTQNIVNMAKRIAERWRDCEQFSDEQLYKKLERIGARNQQFMANTPEEAGKYFKDMIPTAPPVGDSPDYVTKVAFVGPLGSTFGAKGPDEVICDQRCQRIARTIKSEIVKLDRPRTHQMNDPKLRTQTYGDDGPIFRPVHTSLEGIATPRSFAPPCFLEKFVPLANCTPRGEEEFWGYQKLCTACSGVYLLSKNCFPRIFNSVKCNNADLECVYDSATQQAHGKCHMRTLGFRVLHNKGSNQCEDWIYESLEIPIACECYLSTESQLVRADV
ncbi:hypothetical protein AB6A40_003338 [Gnathostoma spinigerum]|uniref:Uncharacterized protein n=1 Tax=Gnathostoma spinigerum TaxID=75299 RepID=A0ABD6EEU0_9BILA